jgi:hypothetical protein
MSLRFTLLAAALFAPCAHAADVPAVHFSGFGTLAWSDQNRGDADYVRPGQPRFSHLGLDSNLGLQASGTLDDIFSGTLQVLARREYTEHYRAAVEWAFVKAKLNDAVGLRVGRMALPAYLVSDSRNVGYANIAVRPPVEVYGQVPLSSLNGADLTATRAWGELTWTAQAGYGRLKNHYDTATIEGRHTLALALALETGPLTVRLGHVRTDLTLTGSEGLAGVLAALRQFGFAPLAERLDPTERQHQGDGEAAAVAVVQADAAAVRLGDLARQRQAQAGAAALGGIERHQRVRHHDIAHAAAAVHHLHRHRVEAAPHRDLHVGGRRARFVRVLQQVEERLLQLRGVGLDRLLRQRAGDGEGHLQLQALPGRPAMRAAPCAAPAAWRSGRSPR